jgi:hypothetical protein
LVLRSNTLELSATVEAPDEQKLQEQAEQLARNLARSLSYEHGEKFEVVYGGYAVETAAGRNVVVRVTGESMLSMSGTLDFELRDATGNIVDSSEIRRAQERDAAQRRVTHLATIAARDPHLRDMLDHWSRYAADPNRRLHSLYDVLQVAQRLYGSSMEAASTLGIKERDLEHLARISNDRTLLTGRHPGESQGPHRTPTESEASTCERVARLVIEQYASKLTSYGS